MLLHRPLWSVPHVMFQQERGRLGAHNEIRKGSDDRNGDFLANESAQASMGMQDAIHESGPLANHRLFADHKTNTEIPNVLETHVERKSRTFSRPA
ncbi:hypothetical protein DXC29_09055 [Bifidobacterium pseudocatenulatum]|nr:hypothetical protein DXC29_09055 [Bifidobacterium pseudocatenulatum]